MNVLKYFKMDLAKGFSNNVLINHKKAVFITGCDSGLGFNFAVHLKSLGVNVFAGVHNISSKGAAFLRLKQIETLSIDVTNKENVNLLSDEMEKVLLKNDYHLCGLINNAGVMTIGEFEWLTPEMIENQIKVNLLGPMITIKAFLPIIRKHSSRIINVTSHCASVSLPGMSVYSASKAGLRAYSDALRRELDKFNLHVIEFLPGSYVSDSFIMSQQSEYFNQMAVKMTEEVKQTYSSYFTRYANYLGQVPSGDKSFRPPFIDDPPLYSKLEHALFSPNPKNIYVNQPLRYALYYNLFSLLPKSKLKDFFIRKFIMMPEWKAT